MKEQAQGGQKCFAVRQKNSFAILIRGYRTRRERLHLANCLFSFVRIPAPQSATESAADTLSDDQRVSFLPH